MKKKKTRLKRGGATPGRSGEHSSPYCDQKKRLGFGDVGTVVARPIKGTFHQVAPNWLLRRFPAPGHRVRDASDVCLQRSESVEL